MKGRSGRATVKEKSESREEGSRASEGGSQGEILTYLETIQFFYAIFTTACCVVPST